MLKKLVAKMVSVFTAVSMTATMAAAMAGFTAHGAEQADYDELVKEIAMMVNEARAELGLNPVYVVPELCEAAEVRAEESASKFAHKRLDGSSFTTALNAALFPFKYAAENLAAGSSTAANTFEQWRNSPNHWAAIINPEITHMGIGVYYDPNSEYGYYWQQTFINVDKEYADQYLPSDKEIVPEAEGDVTGDGVVNSYDYLDLTEYLTKKKNNVPVYFNPAQLEAADCFQDGMITEADAKVMLRYLLGEYKSLPFIF